MYKFNLKEAIIGWTVSLSLLVAVSAMGHEIATNYQNSGLTVVQYFAVNK